MHSLLKPTTTIHFASIRNLPFYQSDHYLKSISGPRYINFTSNQPKYTLYQPRTLTFYQPHTSDQIPKPSHVHQIKSFRLVHCPQQDGCLGSERQPYSAEPDFLVRSTLQGILHRAVHHSFIILQLAGWFWGLWSCEAHDEVVHPLLCIRDLWIAPVRC